MSIRALSKGVMSAEERTVILLVSGLFLMTAFFFLMRAPYPQSALLSTPILALYAADVLRSAVDATSSLFLYGVHKFKNLLVAVFGLAFGLAIPCTGLHAAHPFAITNADQFSRIRWILNFTQESDGIFDGSSAYIFRPHAYPYSYLGEGVRWRLEHGKIAEKIPKNLVASRCHWIILDARVFWLPRSILMFLKENYIPTLEPNIFTAGKRFTAKDFTARQTSFQILFRGRYAIQSLDNRRTVMIDGVSCKGSILLTRGMHTLRYEGNAGQIMLRWIAPLEGKRLQ